MQNEYVVYSPVPEDIRFNFTIIQYNYFPKFFTIPNIYLFLVASKIEFSPSKMI